jgi:hypothetical protein
MTTALLLAQLIVSVSTFATLIVGAVAVTRRLDRLDARLDAALYRSLVRSARIPHVEAG